MSRKFKAVIETASDTISLEEPEDLVSYLDGLPHPLGIVLVGGDTREKRKLQSILQQRVFMDDPANIRNFEKDSHISRMKFQDADKKRNTMFIMRGEANLDTRNRVRLIGILHTRAEVASTVLIYINQVEHALSARPDSARWVSDHSIRHALALCENPPTRFDNTFGVPNGMPDVFITVN